MFLCLETGGKMGTIFIKNLSKTVHIQDTTRPLLHNLQLSYIDWMHACGARGRCTTCKAYVLEGTENLSSYTPAEERYFAKGALKAGERLACQAVATGDVTIAVPEENKLPHLRYTDV